MLCIDNQHTKPQFNLAAEEYLLKNFTDDIFMLWRNEPSIIIGKHQNALAEINVDYVKANGINVVRRMTGGGAVFHDLGNLNFTFIESHDGEGKASMDFRKYTQPILDILQNLGIDARFEGRNDLTIDGKKFSGNAECIYKNRVLHHGTILFSAQLPDLSAALKVDPAKFNDKSVKSVRSRVTNVSEHLSKPLDVIEFKNLIFNHIMEMYKDAHIYQFTEKDIKAIENLKTNKYDSYEWNFGQSPEYNFRKVVKTSGGFVEFDLMVDKGIIQSARIFGDFFSLGDTDEIEQALQGVAHAEEAVNEVFDRFDLSLYFSNISREELLSAMF
ncbi:MAG: lipoate--protein ligase [Bacteroidales bacterium]|nr:lipoate--protein ligase [Bacteroidales bacterium]